MEHSRIDELLTQLVKMDDVSRSCLKDARELLAMTGTTISTTENAMFNLYASSNESTADRLHGILKNLKNIEGFAKQSIDYIDNGIAIVENAANTLIWAKVMLDDAGIEMLTGDYLEGIRMAEMMRSQIAMNIEMIAKTKVAVEHIEIMGGIF